MGTIAHLFAWGTPVAALVVSFVFLGINEASASVESPFATDTHNENVLPLDGYGEELRADSLCILQQRDADTEKFEKLWGHIPLVGSRARQAYRELAASNPSPTASQINGGAHDHSARSAQYVAMPGAMPGL